MLRWARQSISNRAHQGRELRGRLRAALRLFWARVRWLSWEITSFPDIEPPNPWAIVATPWVVPHYIRQKAVAPFVSPPPLLTSYGSTATTTGLPAAREAILDRQVNIAFLEILSLQFTGLECAAAFRRKADAVSRR